MSGKGSGRLMCPFCESYEVERLYLASLRVDSCACASCGARWEEDPVSGEYLGRAQRESTATPIYRSRTDGNGNGS